MTKQTITKWWVSGAVVMLIAGVMLIPAAVLAVAPEIARNDSASRGLGGMNVTAATWATVGFFFLSCAIAAAGYIAQVVAWIGAAFNTHRLLVVDWPGYVVGGVIGIGVMLTNVVGGSGSTPAQQSAPTAAAAVPSH